ncbi:MAG: arginine repressor [Planctomycetes bacterium]|nr:arginine repressor [Planctomycetota bacterium]
MTRKAERQRAILDLVRGRRVATQLELRRLLKARGHDVNQGTLSRDIHELGLLKAADGGGTRYATVEEVTPVVRTESTALLARLVKAADWSGNLVVVQTDPGSANAVGVAVDHLQWPEILGTVAGDDTLLVVVREGTRARTLARRLLNLRTDAHVRTP